MSAFSERDAVDGGKDANPFYFNISHWRAVDGILEGVEQRDGLMVMTGPPGSGKTMIIRAISDGLKENTPPLFLRFASLNFREFVNFLHSSLKVEDEIAEAPNKAVALREFLYIQAKRGETGVVFIDEAQNLEPDVLKMLPKLSRFDTLDDGRAVGLQFVLIGNADLHELLGDLDLTEVRESILRQYELRFFTRAELAQFLNKRLAPIARMTDEPITDDAIEAIGRYTGGSPRLIGMICSHAMLFAAENPGKSIDIKMVEEAAEALMLKEIDNPFAHEDLLPKAAQGPYSAADLDGAARVETPEPTPFSDVDTVYADPDGDDDRGPEFSGSGELFKAAPGTATEASPAPDSIGPNSADAFSDGPIGDTAMQDDDSEDAGADFDPTALDRALEDADLEFDDDDDDELFDDDDDVDALEEDKPKARAAGKAGIGAALSAGGLMAILRGGGVRKGGSDKKIRGAARRQRPDAAQGKPKVKPRRTSARIPGEREKKVKLAAIAAGVVVLLGGAFMAKGAIFSAVAGVKQNVASMVGGSEPAPAQRQQVAQPRQQPQAQPVRTVAAPAPVPTAPANAVQAPSPAPVTVAVKNPAPRIGGWGARVVAGDEATEAPVKTVELKLPDTARSMIAGTLEQVEKAVGVGERNSDDTVKGVLAAATDSISKLRQSVVEDGMSAELKKSKAAEMARKGHELLKQRRLIEPAGDNAYESFRRALELDPNNASARDGIKTLRQHFTKKAEGARSANQWESANRYFEMAISISNLRPI